jgi:hypothetical protein
LDRANRCVCLCRDVIAVYGNNRDAVDVFMREGTRSRSLRSHLR